MPEPLDIRLLGDTPAERLTRDALSSILAKYDCAGLIFTREMEIGQDAHPHSHPVLTLSTAWKSDEHRLLAEFLHEQLHWFEEANAAVRDAAIARTVELYPSVPFDPPEGAGSEDSTRLHLLVCNLEYQALIFLLGATAAGDTLRELATHHYCWVYRTVLNDRSE